jgi:hypothetical protein
MTIVQRLHRQRVCMSAFLVGTPRRGVRSIRPQAADRSASGPWQGFGGFHAYALLQRSGCELAAAQVPEGPHDNSRLVPSPPRLAPCPLLRPAPSPLHRPRLPLPALRLALSPLPPGHSPCLLRISLYLVLSSGLQPNHILAPPRGRGKGPMKTAAVLIMCLALIVGILPQFTDCQSQGKRLSCPMAKVFP